MNRREKGEGGLMIWTQIVRLAGSYFAVFSAIRINAASSATYRAYPKSSTACHLSLFALVYGMRDSAEMMKFIAGSRPVD
jgi:predicted homoserine dehydrogenase-like protein